MRYKESNYLNLAYFISQRLSKKSDTGFSKLIVKIATLAVALSILVMIVAISISRGYQKEIQNKVIGFHGHIQITPLDLNNSIEGLPIRRDSIFERIARGYNGVEHFEPYATKTGIIKTKSDFKGVILKGIDQNYNWTFIRNNLKEGSVFSLSQSKVSNDVVISKTTADRLNLHLNDAMYVYFIQDPPRVRKFNIVGVFDSGLSELDEIYAFVDMRQCQRLNAWGDSLISGYQINTTSFTNIDSELDKLSNITPYTMGLQSVSSTYPSLFSWLSLLDTNVLIIIILMIVVACINMITALLILIIERSHMIGILKAMGAKRRLISRIFLLMASRIILLGLLIGNVTGIGLCLLQQKFGFIKLNQKDYFISQVPIDLSFDVIAMINISSFIISVMVLLLPSSYVAKIKPAKVIKWD
ncbi:MAG: FtsX-like permease family protein [Bacteroidota bacterium]